MDGTGCAYFRNHTWTKAEVLTNIALFGDQLGWVSSLTKDCTKLVYGICISPYPSGMVRTYTPNTPYQIGSTWSDPRPYLAFCFVLISVCLGLIFQLGDSRNILVPYSDPIKTHTLCTSLRKKVEPKWCLRGAILENGSSLAKRGHFLELAV